MVVSGSGCVVDGRAVGIRGGSGAGRGGRGSAGVEGCLLTDRGDCGREREEKTAGDDETHVRRPPLGQTAIQIFFGSEAGLALGLNWSDSTEEWAKTEETKVVQG